MLAVVFSLVFAPVVAFVEVLAEVRVAGPPNGHHTQRAALVPLALALSGSHAKRQRCVLRLARFSAYLPLIYTRSSIRRT